MSLAAKKGHHCSAKHLQPLVQQHCLAPPAQNQYFLERNVSLEKLSSDLGRGHSRDMGNTSVRSSTRCLFICWEVPVDSSLVQVFLPSRHLRQSAHKEQRCLFQMSSLPSAWTQAISAFRAVAEGQPFHKEKTNREV